MNRWLLALVVPALALSVSSTSALASGKGKAAAGTRVAIETSAGQIVVELFPDKTPVTVKNFLDYVKAGYYDGLIFHRVIAGFMIQGGGFTPDLKPRKVRAPIALEAGRGLSNLRGTLAMARTSDPNSATSQFFVNVVDNQRLDELGGGYCVFGKVIKGMDVVDGIAKQPTSPRGGQANVPSDTVVIKGVKLLK